MIADVKVWRAWYHMQLLLWYGRNDVIPIVSTALSGEDIYQKRNSVEGIKLYRNNYQRRLMQAKRSESEQVKLAFENWKELAKSKIKEFNANKISEEEYLNIL